MRFKMVPLKSPTNNSLMASSSKVFHTSPNLYPFLFFSPKWKFLSISKQNLFSPCSPLPIKPLPISSKSTFSATMPINKECTPPPVIGKVGRYTVFMTPPTTSKPQSPPSEPKSESPKIPSPLKVVPPVQPPPQQFEKGATFAPSANKSALGFFWNAVAKVQHAHSSLDAYLAEWFGLDHSKYQWALDDYYESNGMEKGNGKLKELAGKAQSV